MAFAELVAVTVTDCELVTDGAVNRPALEMVPALADQVMAVLLLRLTVAVNCCVPAETTEALVGEIATLTPVRSPDEAATTMRNR